MHQPTTRRRRAHAALLAVSTAATIAATLACARRPAAVPASAPAGTHWVATWGASPQRTEPANMPPAPGLAGSTLRQVVHLSLGGRALRLRFANTFGGGPLTIAAARVARSVGMDTIDTATDRALTFGGRPGITIAAGETATSDPLPFDAPALADLAISVQLTAVPPEVTGHPGSRTTSYLQPGDATAAPVLPQAARTDHWYLLSGIDVAASDGAAAIVALGNSITDGRGSGTNRQNRWPDELARRLQGDPRTPRVAVVNAGIGGNAVLAGGLGPPAVERFERDVLQQPAVRWVIVLEGVNDIGGSPPARAADVATRLIAAYRDMASRARQRGLRVYGATILPFGGSFYDAPEREAARQTVNRWIRTGGAYDAVIDLDAAMRDPANPTRLRAEADGGDHLHPNERGYRMMAEAIDLQLFQQR
jgi:lysophospholipase L1-like esterase